MSLRRDRLRVVLRTMRYRDAWRFRPGQSLAMLRYLRHTRPTWRAGEAETNVYAPPVGSPAYARYLRGLNRLAHGEWTPLVAHVSVTDRCPYSCRRCSNVARRDGDPSLPMLRTLIEQLHAAGTARVALTGGEPLLRDDLPDIVSACGPLLSPVVFTSGHGLTTSRARELRQSGLAAAFVSLDHFLPEEHDRLRGRPGAFHQALAAIDACRHAGLYTAIQAVVLPSLLENGRLEHFLAFCDRLQPHEIMLLEEVPIAGLKESDDSFKAVRERLAQLQRRSARDATLPKVSSMSWLESPECLGCQAGFSFLFVTAHGDVTPCDFVPLSFGNLHETDVQTIHDRMQRTLKHPARRCLARLLPTRYTPPAEWPVPWPDSRTILRDYDPGPPPSLLQSLCHGTPRPH